MSDAGIVLKIRLRDGDDSWMDAAGEVHLDGGSDDCGDFHEAVEATFVDDEALVIVAKSSAKLDAAIDTMLLIIREVFHDYALTINWAKGKSEALLIYRGKHAARTLDARRRAGTAGLFVKLPHISSDKGPDQFVHVVTCFKHLGGHVTADGGLGTEATYRSSSAMQAYVPLAGKIFGSPHVAAQIKQSFCDSLVLSRLLYNAQIWVPKQRDMCKYKCGIHESPATHCWKTSIWTRR